MSNRNLRGFAHHCLRAAVFCHRKVDSACDGGFIYLMAGDDMLDGNIGENLWVNQRAYAMNSHLIVGHILAHLAEYGDNIHCRATCCSQQQQFHWRRPLSVWVAAVNDDFVPAARSSTEYQALPPGDDGIKFSCHALSVAQNDVPGAAIAAPLALVEVALWGQAAQPAWAGVVPPAQGAAVPLAESAAAVLACQAAPPD